MIEGTLERARQEPRVEFYFAVAKACDEARVIGFARIGLAGVKAGTLDYAIAAGERGHGYATDAARTLTSYEFAELGLHRVSAAIGPDNARSIALVAKLGFSREGVLRDHVFMNGAWRDSLLYSLLAPEWQENNVRLQRATEAFNAAISRPGSAESFDRDFGKKSH